MVAVLQQDTHQKISLKSYFFQTIDASWNTSPGKVPFFELLLIFSGEGFAVIEGKEILLRKGSVVLIGPGAKVQGRLHSGPLKIASFHFHWKPQRTEKKTSQSAWVHFVRKNLQEVEERCVAIAAHPTELRLREVILEEILLLLHGTQMENEYDSRLYPIFKHIECYKGKKNCTVPVFCKMAGVSPRQLTRIFRHATGYSPVEYCLHYRMELVKSRLLDRGVRVHEVAEEMGYTHEYLLIRQFKKVTGKTPKQFQMAQ